MFQSIAQHSNCKLMNAIKSDIILFCRRFSGIFGLLMTDVGFGIGFSKYPTSFVFSVYRQI